MAQQGSLTPTGWDVNIDGSIFGQTFVMPSTFTMNWLDAVLDETTGTGNHVTGAAIYRTSDGVLIQQSSTRNDVTTGGYATYRFSGWSGSIAAGTYAFVLLSDQGAGNMNMRGDFNAGTSVSQGSLFTGGVFPDPATLSADNFNAALLIDYTEGGASTGRSRIIGGKLIGGILVRQ